jgi:hypothetical protein
MFGEIVKAPWEGEPQHSILQPSVRYIHTWQHLVGGSSFVFCGPEGRIVARDCPWHVARSRDAVLVCTVSVRAVAFPVCSFVFSPRIHVAEGVVVSVSGDGETNAEAMVPELGAELLLPSPSATRRKVKHGERRLARAVVVVTAPLNSKPSVSSLAMPALSISYIHTSRDTNLVRARASSELKF